MPSKCCECCSAFHKKVFKDFASVAKDFKDAASLRNLQIVAHPLNVAEFAVPS